jgi:hypothetical protein
VFLGVILKVFFSLIQVLSNSRSGSANEAFIFSGARTAKHYQAYAHHYSDNLFNISNIEFHT